MYNTYYYLGLCIHYAQLQDHLFVMFLRNLDMYMDYL